MEAFVFTYFVKQGLKVRYIFGVYIHHGGVDGIFQSLAKPQEVHESLARRVLVRVELLNDNALNLLKCSLNSQAPSRW